ncbi:hypothetical protein [Deinococcus sp.]|uniref:hypothetical protein n=1 Tax=Deinococcus sp. TaxID=47478 RepID=UPI0025F1B18F|nr:hypothetical protein [Deinococcus sp.]
MPTVAKARRERRTLLKVAQCSAAYLAPARWITDDTPHYLADLGLHREPWIVYHAHRDLPRVIRVGRGEYGLG